MMARFILVLLLWSTLPVMAQPAPPAPPEREAVWLFGEGQKLHAEGRVLRAVDLYRNALNKDPGRLEYRPYLGLALDQAGLPEEALEQYDLYLALEPQDARIRLNRAVALAHAGKLEEAWKESERLTTLLPAQAALFNLRGVILLGQGDPQRALAELTTALSLEDAPEIRVNLAAAHLARGELEPARHHLESVLRSPSDPGQAQLARNNLGVVLTMQAELEQAEQSFDEASGEGEDLLPVAIYNLVSVLARQGKTQEALLAAAELVDARPDYTDARLLYARLLYRQDRFEAAQTELEQVLEQQPDSAVAQETMGLVLLATGRAEQARPYLEKAVVASPQSAWAHHNLALALGRLGDLSEALREEKEALALDDDNPAIWYHLGLLHDLNAEPRDAIAAYRRYLELQTSESTAAIVKEHIQELEAYIAGQGRRTAPQGPVR
ncbi:MAG: tetratricopeptide repeat protein [Armatimonadetes bacterium]|nr:tetratricopeptide repeat protein [Armatimonadota bacterium]